MKQMAPFAPEANDRKELEAKVTGHMHFILNSLSTLLSTTYIWATRGIDASNYWPPPEFITIRQQFK